MTDKLSERTLREQILHLPLDTRREDLLEVSEARSRIADEVAALEDNYQTLLDDAVERRKELRTLEQRVERLEDGLRHIKRWSSGNMVSLDVPRLMQAVANMCDDALASQEEA